MAYSTYHNFNELSEAITKAQNSSVSEKGGNSGSSGGGKVPVTVLGGGTPVPKTDSTNYGNNTDIKD